jgi:hypothetical protein
MTKIAPWVMEQTINGQQAEFMVVLVDQADLSPAAALATKTEKGRYRHFIDRCSIIQCSLLPQCAAFLSSTAATEFKSPDSILYRRRPPNRTVT